MAGECKSSENSGQERAGRRVRVVYLKEQSASARIRRYPTPLGLLIVIIISIFTAEVAVMLLLHVLPELSIAVKTILDAFLLSVLVFPVLYFLLFRPLMFQIILREKSEDDLKKQRDALEEMVEHRVSKIRESNHALKEARKMEALGTLAGGIAHDFNNILGAVIGFADMARDDVPPGTVAHQNLAEVLTAARRAKDLVRQILAFSRASQVKPVPVQIDAVADEALAMLRGSLPATIEIVREIDCDSVVMGDNTQIHQVLINLCKNAVDAMADTGGILKVSIAEVDVDHDSTIEHAPLHAGPHVKITVEDTGCGMSREVQERIFEPFYSTKEVGKGSGMGLSVVHGIVSNHGDGGAIAVESTPGKGTTFEVFLPVAGKSKTLDREEIVL